MKITLSLRYVLAAVLSVLLVLVCLLGVTKPASALSLPLTAPGCYSQQDGVYYVSPCPEDVDAEEDGECYLTWSGVDIYGSYVNEEIDCETGEVKPNLVNSPTGCGGRTFMGIPAWDKYLEHEQEAGTGRCVPVVNGTESIGPIGIAVLEAMLRLAALVAVVMVVVGAFKFIITQGDPEKAAGARKTVINALVGLVIVIVSASIVGFIGNRLG